MTNQEISKQSGLTIKRVGEISRLSSWGRVDVEQASRFALACGVDLVHQAKTRKYLLRREGAKMNHIKRSPNKRYLLELLEL